MAVIESLRERLRVAETIVRLATTAAEYHRDIVALEESLQKDEQGMDLSFAKTQIEGALSASHGIYNVLKNNGHVGLLDSSLTPSSIWPVSVSPSFAADLTAFSIDNVASPPTITAIGGAPFDAGVFAVADIVEITGAENPEHNGRATITIITTTVMTLTAGDLPGTGAINSNDTAATITLLER